jgi:hypothetical protein
LAQLLYVLRHEDSVKQQQQRGIKEDKRRDAQQSNISKFASANKLASVIGLVGTRLASAAIENAARNHSLKRRRRQAVTRL